MSSSDITSRPTGLHRARLTASLAAAVALASTSVAALVAWSWRAILPDPVATHWGAQGADGFSSLGAYLWLMIAVVTGCAALFGAIAWFSGQTAATRRITTAASVWVGGLGAGLVLGPLAVQRGLADAADAALPGWVLVVAILGPIVPAVAAALLMPGDPPMPATGDIDPEAPRVHLDSTERAVWIRRTTGGPGIAVGSVAVVLTAMLAGTLREWALLAVPAALAIVLAAMFSYTVRVDATGLTVRSTLGWPRSHVPADEVQAAGVTDVNPFGDFGGWGWRVGARGRTGVILRKGATLEVERSAGRIFVVTVDDPQDGAALLNTMAERARASTSP